MFGQKILKIHCIDIGLVRVQVFSLMLQRSSSISVHTGGYAEEILLKDSSLSVNVKSSGFPYGFQHCKSLDSFADPCDVLH